VNVTYLYQNNQPDYKHESIITPLAKAVSKIIELPDAIEVCLYDLGKSVYGGIDLYRVNRIGINYTLPYDGVAIILVHELIHVCQKHTGRLRITARGHFYWHGILITKKLSEDLAYSEYMNLPWELDAYNKQHKVLSQALDILLTKK
jgi:hypothetical protein